MKYLLLSLLLDFLACAPRKSSTTELNSAQSVSARLAELTADRTLDESEVISLFNSAGDNTTPEEAYMIFNALYPVVPSGPLDASMLSLRVPEAARNKAHELALKYRLPEDEYQRIAEKKSFAETAVPAAVIEVMTKARLAGAVAYDVDETRVNNNGTTERIWTPYPSTSPATLNMTFKYTEITPQILNDDMKSTEESNWMLGESAGRMTYRKQIGGTGHILSHYDEVRHPDIFARGPSGQKWANNFAIMSDGTIHCLPASRRHPLAGLILTNPHLSREKFLMYTGHLDIEAGEVVAVEMSGRISKMAGSGDYAFIDPIAVLKAWGFKLRSGLSIKWGNTEDGVPVVDERSHTIRNRIP